MSTSSGKVYLRAAGFGVLAGMRSMTPLELVVSDAARDPQRLAATPLGWLLHPLVRGVLRFLRFGEFVFDKLPFVPSRTHPVLLFGRVLFGTLAGLVTGIQARRSPLVCAVLGGLTGFASAHVCYTLRSRATTALAVPSPVTGLGEDALVLTLGPALLRATGPLDE